MQEENEARIQLEVCVEDAQGAEIAMKAGATRIELSEQLGVGGITPSLERLSDILNMAEVPVIALIRCRPGHFVYTMAERKEMLRQCEAFLERGVHGIAVGAIGPRSSDAWEDLDWDFLESIAGRFSGRELVVHRAFDVVTDPIAAAIRLSSTGYTRILTSGGPDKASEGLATLHALQSLCLIEILPAGGIGSHNAEMILKATGCTQLHGSFRSPSSLSNPISPPDPSEIANVLQCLHRI
ncbi:Copper homeostasis protein CutC [Pirellula sp. SH-Sr6A]|uniref:copper homeostasis protein CutC n=1 Tax=Pirellula sp. SH-Sr6A TaxID=1632865 RepID=UPI00078D7089|nr:copper homeostasis protein CutC [Pirellula sp. SH-Sr6A]AMV33399.1 Copper homeostasis protein CutC [Pirellula sp. SH-Sr6A]